MASDRTPALGATEVHDLHSEAVGDTFHLFVGECGAEPECVLVVADGNGLFGLTVDTIRMMRIPGLVPPIAVVAVGYPGASTISDTVEIRARDFTPTRRSMFAQSGGADRFADFLTNELRPWVADRFPAAQHDLTYFGHSLGGLFGAYSLLTRPGLFHRHIISSPSLWWDRQMIFGTEEHTSQTLDDIVGSAFFGIGELETHDGRLAESANLPGDHPAKPPAAYLDMVDDMRRFTAQLSSRRYPSLDLQSMEIPSEFHATVPGIVLSRALRHFWS